MYDEDDLLPISALQHLAFCERQCALIHIERLWDENQLTASGRQLHARTHAAGSELRYGVRTVRGLRLQSLRLGLWGQADVVEFHPTEPPEPVTDPWDALPLPEGIPTEYRVMPVEYKRGKPKRDRCDEVQLCAQALCLEEMLGVAIEQAALYYAQTRTRHYVILDPLLRELTEGLARRLRELIESGVTPPPANDRRCRGCSLADKCLPGAARSASRYLLSAIREAAHEPEDEP